jgi:hypothetical protein
MAGPDDFDLRKRGLGRSASGRRIVIIDAVDQIGDFLDRPNRLDDPVGVKGFRAELRAHPFVQEGLGRLPHVDVRIELARDSLIHHDRLLQQ